MSISNEHSAEGQLSEAPPFGASSSANPPSAHRSPLRFLGVLLPLPALWLVGSMLQSGAGEDDVALAGFFILGATCYLAARLLRGFPRRPLHHLRQVAAAVAIGGVLTLLLTALVETPEVSVEGSEMYPFGVFIIAGLGALSAGLVSLVLWGIDALVQRRRTRTE